MCKLSKPLAHRGAMRSFSLTVTMYDVFLDVCGTAGTGDIDLCARNGNSYYRFRAHNGFTLENVNEMSNSMSVDASSDNDMAVYKGGLRALVVASTFAAS